MRLTNEHLTFLARFGRSPEGRFFVEMLEARQAELNALLRTTTGEEVYRTQGEAREVDLWIGNINSAVAKLNRSVPSRPPLGTRFAA